MANGQYPLTEKQEKLRQFLRSQSKIGIIGYTPSNQEAPWGDPEWCLAGCNNLARHLKPEQKAKFWFDLHPISEIRKDEQHVQWLRTTDIPVLVWEEQEDWPTSVTFPKDEMLAKLPNYFTNTISWFYGLLLLWCADTMTDLGTWGVDLATETEYQSQRPSAEFYLGMLIQSGVKVHIPNSSDLLKAPAQYGIEDDTPIRRKLKVRRDELQQKLSHVNQERNKMEAAHHQLTGALDVVNYFLRVWTLPAAERDGSEKDESGTQTLGKMEETLQLTEETSDA